MLKEPLQMQAIQELSINGHKISLYNSVEEPLFEANQVIVTILEYKQLEDCRFYKDNKKNDDFVQIKATGKLSDGQKDQETLTGKMPDRYLGYNRYSESTIYLTEFGLYECLFTSNKPFASQFRLQVMKLLKDLRIGNLRLSVQRECQTTKLIEEYKDSLLSYVARNSDIQTQLEIVKNRLEQCSFLIYIYEQEIVSTGEKYRGSTLAPEIRTKTHKYKSSCIKLKEAYERNEEIKVHILGKAKVYNDNERDYFEQQFILAMPSDKKLNLKTPYPNSFDNISNEHIQYTKNAVQNMVRIPIAEFLESLEPSQPRQLGITINYQEINPSDHFNYVNDSANDSEFKQRILSVKQFISENSFTPRDSDNVDPSERSLGQLLVKIRNAYRTNSNQHYNLTPERYVFAKQEIPIIFQSDNQPFFDKVAQLKSFFEEHNRMPKQRGQNNNNQVESELYDWIAHRRSDHKKGKLPLECLEFITNQLPDFEFIPLTDDEKFKKNIQQLKDFYQQHNHYPLQKENKKLQTYIKTLKSANTNQDGQSFKLTPERKQYVNQILPNFPW